MIAKLSEERGDFMLFAKRILSTNRGKVNLNNQKLKIIED
jgi:hypothetical protein